MNSGAIKKRNIALIAVFAIGSVILSGYALSTSISSNAAGEAREKQHQALKKSLKAECIAGLKSTSQTAETLDLKDSIKVIGKSKISDSYGFLTRISTAIQGCPGYQMEYFCMGEDCDKSYFTLDLKEVSREQS